MFFSEHALGGFDGVVAVVEDVLGRDCDDATPRVLPFGSVAFHVFHVATDNNFVEVAEVDVGMDDDVGDGDVVREIFFRHFFFHADFLLLVAVWATVELERACFCLFCFAKQVGVF